MLASIPPHLRSIDLAQAILMELLPKLDEEGKPLGRRLQAWIMQQDGLPVGLVTTMIYDEKMLGRKNLAIYTFLLPPYIEWEDLQAMFGQIKQWAVNNHCTHIEAKTVSGRICAIMKLLGFDVAWRVGEMQL